MRYYGFFMAMTLLGILACSDRTSPLPTVDRQLDLDWTLVSPSTIQKEIILDGVIEAINQSTVSAQTTGRVTELPFDVGDYVEKGQVIARLTNDEQRAKLDAAQAEVTRASAQQVDAEKQYKRVSDIYKKGLVAAAEYDRIETQYTATQASLSAAQAIVKAVSEQMEHTVIKAPYSGIVVNRKVDLGETVGPGSELLTGLSLEHLRIVVNIPQHNIGPLRKHRKARVIMPDGESVVGETLRISPGADAITHTFQALLSLPVGEYNVFPGTLVKVAFVSGEDESILLPAAAIARRGEVTAVYVIKPNDILEFRYLRLGTETAEALVPVLAGLLPGEKIALDPILAAKAYRQKFEQNKPSTHE